MEPRRGGGGQRPSDSTGSVLITIAPLGDHLNQSLGKLENASDARLPETTGTPSVSEDVLTLTDTLGLGRAAKLIWQEPAVYCKTIAKLNDPKSGKQPV